MINFYLFSTEFNFIFKCYECNGKFYCREDYLSHEKHFHKRDFCLTCKLFFDSENDHMNKCRKNVYKDKKKFKYTGYLERSGTNQIGYSSNKFKKFLKNSKFVKIKSSFKNFLMHFELINGTDYKDLDNFFTFYRKDISDLIEYVIKNHGSVKIQFCTQILFNRMENDLIVEQIGYFSTKFDPISHIDLFSKFFSKKFLNLIINFKNIQLMVVIG